MRKNKLVSKMIEISRRRAKKKGLTPIDELMEAVQVVADPAKWAALEKQAKKELKK